MSHQHSCNITSKAKPKKTTPTCRAVAARISIIYALVAGVWIYASDALLAWFIGSPPKLALFQTYKGWLFVAVTALLLYGLISNALTTARAQPPFGLDRSDLSRLESIPPAPSLWRNARTPFLIFFLLASAIGGIGYLVYTHQKEILQKEKAAELLAIADTKVAEITHWITERRNDVEMITRDPFIALAVKRWLSAGAPTDEDGKRLLAWLTDLLQDSLDYSAVLLADDKGQVRLRVGVVEIHPKQQELALQAIQSDQSIMSDLHWDQEIAGEKIGIDLLAPLGRGSAGEGQPVGALLFKIDPERYLFPLMQIWPTPSPSAETLLVRREGDEVLYLNALRHRKNIPLRFRLPVSSEHLIAALAVRGQEGVVEGVDYRQVPVLAAVHAVPRTAWFLIAKVDAEEVYAPTRTLTLLVAIVVGILIIGAGMGTGLWWQQQHARFLADRYRRELEHQTLVQHLDYLAKYANDIILLVDENHRIIEVNDRALEAYGRSREELLGMPASELRVPATCQDFLRDHEKLDREGKTVYQTWHQRGDGTPFPVEASARTLEIAGKRYYQFIIRDITERTQVEEALRDSEARFRATFEQAAVGIAHVAADGRFLRVNQKLCQLSGYTQAELLERSFQDLTPPDDLQAELGYIYQVLAGELNTYSLEKRYYRKDGSLIWVNLTVSLVREASGEPKYFIAVIEDISQRKRTEEQLRQAQKMEAVGQLTGGIAHDFNNLLAIILGNLELLAEALPDRPDWQELIQRPLGAVERGTTLVQRLLAFARRQSLQAKPVDLNQLVAGMIDLLQRTLGETIQVQMRLAKDLAQTAIDPGQLETALVNLAVNSRDAMPEGGTLMLETANQWLDEDYANADQLKPGQYVLLAISDTGLGMTPAVLERAFEPFFTTKAVGKGSGLGLSMVYGLVKQSGGHIQLYSEVGSGTTIKLYLPWLEATAGPAPEAYAGEALLQGQAEMILVVEDEVQVRQLTVNLLQSLGYQTVEADTAATALQVLTNTPQVVVLFTDVALPGGRSGIDLAREARQRRPHLKVLFTSGYTEQTLSNLSSLQEGINLLSKPYHKSELANKLHALLLR